VISQSDQGRVRTLLLDRPEALNTLDMEAFGELARALRRSDQDPHVSVVLLRGAGSAFTAGADRGNWEPANRERVRAAFVDVVTALAQLTKPLVCAVHGVAIGFGGTLLGHADVVIMAADARVRMPFGELGMVPEAGSSVTFPALLGHQRAFWTLVGSPWLSGADCVGMGLALRACPAAELVDVAMAHAQQLSRAPVAVLQASKRLLTSDSRKAVQEAMQRELEAADALLPRA
jgi:enoyl-CoA hydratase/carnithine racemase